MKSNNTENRGYKPADIYGYASKKPVNEGYQPSNKSSTNNTSNTKPPSTGSGIK